MSQSQDATLQFVILDLVNELSDGERTTNREIRLKIRKKTNRPRTKYDINSALQSLVSNGMITRTQEGKQSFFSPIKSRWTPKVEPIPPPPPPDLEEYDEYDENVTVRRYIPHPEKKDARIVPGTFFTGSFDSGIWKRERDEDEEEEEVFKEEEGEGDEIYKTVEDIWRV